MLAEYQEKSSGAQEVVNFKYLVYLSSKEESF